MLLLFSASRASHPSPQSEEVYHHEYHTEEAHDKAAQCKKEDTVGDSTHITEDVHE